ncbi:MAG TPA: amidohydrolase family protein [Longimicrobiales bacterium]|nr:amidohydrolase family protein [Longimicrobiales bacterium]
MPFLRVRPSVLTTAVLTTALLLSPIALHAQRGVEHSPPRADDGGPYDRLIIRGATVVDGTGAPPVGPMDIVIEGNRIIEVRGVGAPGLPIDDRRRPDGATREIDAEGMYVLPGFVDLHAHQGGAQQGTPAEYVHKLWLGHGITTIRDPGSGNGVDWTLEEARRSERNEIAAPRIFVYVRPGMGWDRGSVDSPQKAREYVRWAAERGVDGLKLVSYEPEIMEALLDEARLQGLGTQAHLGQLGVARMNVLDAARLGLGSMEHWYGLPEALFDDRTIQDYPYDYNYNDEYHRFAQAGRLWRQAAEPGSERWNQVMEELLELDFVLDPTLTIYEASRDVMREREAEWHDEYTLPSLHDFFRPSRTSHGSYWFSWTTADEIEWKNNFRIWMRFLNEYKNRGGRVTTGSDAGYIYKLYGFGYIRELELLQEAGFHPLEVVRAATMHGAEALTEPAGREAEFGVIREGALADLVVVPLNPIQDFKVLYGTGTLRLDEDGEVRRVGGVRWTIKDGVVYDAPALLRDVREMVDRAEQGASTVTSDAGPSPGPRDAPR